MTTSGALPPTFTDDVPGVKSTSFAAVTADDIIAAISHLLNKSSAVDPISIRVLKSVWDLVVLHV